MNAATSTAAAAGRFGSGQSVRRLEDDALLAGAGRYTDDAAQRAGTACIPALALPARAHRVAIDAETARAMPGVLAVYTGADLAAAGVKPIPGVAGFRRADGSDGATAPRHVLAHGRARFVGEPVVAVVAQTLQQARDAAEAAMV